MSSWVLILAFGVAGASDASPAPDLAAYEAAKATAGRDADAQVRLALWCEERGMAAERTKHLMRAVLIDPDHARARGLLGQVERDGRWLRPDEVAKAEEASPGGQALLAEYLDRRVKAADTADDQYKLALWCEERGLVEPMAAHLHRTLQLDPGREGAWKRLGFKKVGKRWVDPDVEAALKAARDEQDAADRVWKPRLEKLRDDLTSRVESKREQARAALGAIDDPRAVPMAWRVFVQRGDESRQRAAVEVFSRLEGPGASTALATLAVVSPHAAIRSDAAALLQRRDPREFAGFLVGLLRKETRYKVRQVDGPGGRGELFVEGPDANVRRIYTPLQAPEIPLGIPLAVGADGLMVARIPTGGASSPGAGPVGPLMTLPEIDAARRAEATGTAGRLAESLPAAAGRALERIAGATTTMTPSTAGLDPNSRAFRQVPVYQEFLEIPVGRMLEEARASAMVAREQLTRDVQRLEADAAPVRERNERATAVLKGVSGRDLGPEPEKWAAWAVDLEGYAFRSESRSTETPTYVEDVPIAFQPQAAPSIGAQQVGTLIVGQPVAQVSGRHSCFAAGTPVRTLQGPRPIESIRAGDQVLVEDLTTGAFRYRAVVEAFHNPPNETYRVELDRGGPVVATGIHRFWKAGKGWIMARELSAGDRLRAVGGVVEVKAVVKDQVQPVFNLQVAGGDNFIVGEAGVVAHDNSFVGPVAKPFDVAPATAELVASARP